MKNTREKDAPRAGELWLGRGDNPFGSGFPEPGFGVAAVEEDFGEASAVEVDVGEDAEGFISSHIPQPDRFSGPQFGDGRQPGAEGQLADLFSTVLEVRGVDAVDSDLDPVAGDGGIVFDIDGEGGGIRDARDLADDGVPVSFFRMERFYYFGLCHGHTDKGDKADKKRGKISFHRCHKFKSFQ
jgi:hypothetical protein